MSKRKTDSAMLKEISISIAGYGCPRASTKIREIARRVARDTRRLKWFCDGRISGRDLRTSIDAAMKRERKYGK